MAAGQLLEALVGVLHAGDARDCFGAHDHLDGLGQNFPVLIEVLGDDVGGDVQALQALDHVRDSQHGVAEGYTDVALGGRVGQVALPAGLHQG